MLRKQTLNLYRDILKVLRNIPNEADRKDMLKWAREDFKKNKNEKEEVKELNLIMYHLYINSHLFYVEKVLMLFCLLQCRSCFLIFLSGIYTNDAYLWQETAKIN